ncbi:MAG: 3-succinoylsemialdehyde-pyridine dehydrogenase [Pseudomonadota bacterium]|jgi:acyl-CoA reductase-like NAD-dependent aldehyde dehydrogenase
MSNLQQHYVNGAWVTPLQGTPSPVVNPATEQTIATIQLGSPADVDRAVKAARQAFVSFSQTTPAQRGELLQSIIAVYKKRMDDMASAISQEMGAPLERLAKKAQAPSGLGHFIVASKVLAGFEFQKTQKNTRIVREPVGVCGLITPWNWPANQMTCKIAPALATGCTMVLKPSELAPLSAHILAEILHEAGVPAGVFNLVDGDGVGVGSALSTHPDVDMMSFTGSTRAGILVQKAAAETIKRVALELGGKSANIITEDADLAAAVKHGVMSMMANSGQSCNAPSRMLVPAAKLAEAEAIAAATVAKIKVGDPVAADTTMGPLANAPQFGRVQKMIERGIQEGAKLVAGGTGRPDGITAGYFTRPTVFSNVNNQMDIARQEIFGPVLVMIPYGTEAEAVQIANDTPYGLSGYVFASSDEKAAAIAAQLRTGNVHLNGAPGDNAAPFGGYKQSGNGREWGALGFEEFLETKAVFVPAPPAPAVAA